MQLCEFETTIALEIRVNGIMEGGFVLICNAAGGGCRPGGGASWGKLSALSWCMSVQERVANFKPLVSFFSFFSLIGTVFYTFIVGFDIKQTSNSVRKFSQLNQPSHSTYGLQNFSQFCTPYIPRVAGFWATFKLYADAAFLPWGYLRWERGKQHG